MIKYKCKDQNRNDSKMWGRKEHLHLKKKKKKKQTNKQNKTKQNQIFLI